MSKKLIYLVCFVLVMSVADNASAELILHWTFDEGSGTTVNDSSGNGHDGAINGTPQWVPGIAGGALHFDGSTYVVVADDIGEFETFSIALWFKYDSFIADWNSIWHNNGWQTGWLHYMVANYAGQDIRVQFALNGLSPGNDQFGITTIETNVWYHSTVTYDSITGQINLYLTTDEERKANLDIALSVSGPATIITAGQIGGWEGGRLSSATFDDIRMYDHILSEVEILGAMAGKIWPYALGPVPADGALHPDTWVSLSWSPGYTAVSHDVYFGDNFDDVEAGTEDTFQGNQTATYFAVGSYRSPYLVPGVTYYWRVDEVEARARGTTTHKGVVWSFRTLPEIDPNLIAWYRFDGNALDSSGNDLHGTEMGNPTYEAGVFGQAISLDGDGDYVDCGASPEFDITDEITFTYWIKVFAFDKGWDTVLSKGDDSWRSSRAGFNNFMEAAVTGTTGDYTLGVTPVDDDQWHHVGFVYDGTMNYLYVDGEVDASEPSTGQIDVSSYPLCIGANSQHLGEGWSSCWNGLIDDVQIYNRALSQEEVQIIMQSSGGEYSQASSPVPADGALNPNTWVSLSWSPGYTAVSHDVYFGENFDDVEAGTKDTFQGNQTATYFAVGSARFPYLVPGVTYYWRVDEVEVRARGTTTHKGDVWRFTCNTSAGLPAGWSSRDIGSPRASGSASYNDAEKTWTVRGDGHDIWGNSDAFHFVYIPLSGDGMIVARVLDNGSGSDSWAKGGVMIRETLDANSKHAMMIITGGAGAGKAFQCRQSTGSYSFSSHGGAQVSPPMWVKLVREGNLFTGYYSVDGVDWEQQPNPIEINMTRDVYIGLCVTSVVVGEVRTYTFDNVNTELLKSALRPDPADGALYEDTSVSLSWVPGAYTVSHDVYLGDNFNDVEAGTEDTFQVKQSETYFLVGLPEHPYPDGLVPGTTYYWRVDEVEADGITIYKGDVWTFSIPPRAAYEPEPGNGAEYVYPNIELSWSSGFGAQMHIVYFGDNFDDVNINAGGILQETTTYSPGPLEWDKVYYWRVDEFDGAVIHKGDVWSFRTIPEIDPTLIGWWKFDEGSGTIAYDSSGNGNDGTFNGDPQWVPNQFGYALEFDGSGDWLDCGEDPSLQITDAVTVSAWIKVGAQGIDHKIGGNQDDANGGYKMTIHNNRVEFEIRTATNLFVLNRNVSGGTEIMVDVWYHVTGVYSLEGGYIRTYVNGVLDREMSTTDVLGASPGSFKIGCEPFTTGSYSFNGVMDDIRIYNHALTEGEILGVMEDGEEWPYAFNPEPADGALNANTWVSLGWSPGYTAVSHDVYFGDNFDDVEAGTEDTFQGNQTATYFAVGSARSPYLVPGVTYYWRIDEVNDNNPGSPWKGEVWSFSTAPDIPTPPKGRGCFLADTPVWVNGALVQISNVVSGQMAGGLYCDLATDRLEQIETVEEHLAKRHCNPS